MGEKITKCPECGKNLFNVGTEKSWTASFNEKGVLEMHSSDEEHVVTIECSNCGRMFDPGRVKDVTGW